MENKNTPTIIVTGPNKQNGAVDYVFKGALIVGLFYGGRFMYRKWQANRQTDAAGGDPNIQMATEIHQAIDGAGTSEKVLFNVANRIGDWAEVSKAYRKLYNVNMLDDIKGDLSASDYQKFINLYNLGQKNADGSPKNSKNPIIKGQYVIAEKEAYIRKSPVYMKVLPGLVKAFDFLNASNNNAVALAKPSEVIGVLTGVFSDDTKSPDATRYLQVLVPVLDAKNNHELVKMWVASSQVKTAQLTPTQLKTYKLVKVSKAIYSSALSGITNNTVSENIKIYSKGDLVGIYDESIILKDYARKNNIILGYKLLVQSTDNKDMVSYQTIDGNIRNSFKEQIKEVIELS